MELVARGRRPRVELVVDVGECQDPLTDTRKVVRHASSNLRASSTMDPKMFLAENVLNERRIVCLLLDSYCFAPLTPFKVTYRSLSRSLKVHAQKAKQYVPWFRLQERSSTHFEL